MGIIFLYKRYFIIIIVSSKTSIKNIRKDRINKNIRIVSEICKIIYSTMNLSIITTRIVTHSNLFGTLAAKKNFTCTTFSLLHERFPSYLDTPGRSGDLRSGENSRRKEPGHRAGAQRVVKERARNTISPSRRLWKRRKRWRKLWNSGHSSPDNRTHGDIYFGNSQWHTRAPPSV